jgi:benzoyl-CoA reductase/2-hydroxyglutaryl-CoA dehydratase subunit BcrC/BadD/HgdB
MKKPASLYFSLVLSVSIIASSCGGGNLNNKAITSFNVNAILAEERPLTSEEIKIATRICYAYQSKSQKFRSSEYFGSKFIFSGKNTDCQNTSTNYQISTTLKYNAQNTLEYVTSPFLNSALTVNKKVQTETSGYLAQLCPKIFTNRSVSNTTTAQNYKVQISFIRNNLDSFYLQYFNQVADSSYKIESSERFDVVTDIGSDYKINGMDQFYSAQRVCPSAYDKNKFSNFEQTFISQ